MCDTKIRYIFLVNWKTQRVWGVPMAHIIQCGGPQVVSWCINPIIYSYRYDKHS